MYIVRLVLISLFVSLFFTGTKIYADTLYAVISPCMGLTDEPISSASMYGDSIGFAIIHTVLYNCA